MRKLLLILFLVSAVNAQQMKPILGQQINWGHPLSKGLVGFWLMNEGTGNKVYDLSNNNNDGTLDGASWVTSDKGYAIDFDGTDDTITMQHTDDLILNAFSIVLRIRTDQVASDSYMISHYDGTSQDGFYIRFDNNGLMYFVVFVGGSPGICNSDVGVQATDTWFNIVATRDVSGFMQLYIDGKVQSTTDTQAGEIDSSAVLRLGTDYSGANDLDGKINYFYLYNRALTILEIQQLYREPFCMFRDPFPIELWQTAAALEEHSPQVIMIQMSIIPILLISFVAITYSRFRDEIQ